MTDLATRAAALTLTPVTSADPALARAVRDIRNEDAVRRNMYRDSPISPAEHDRWLTALGGDASVRYFLVQADGALIGSVAFSRIDPAHRRADWAFFLSETVQGRGFGRALELRALDHAFGPLALHKLNCEVIAWNTAVIALHRRFGFVHEGTRRAHVLRDGVFHDVELLGITAPEWAAARPGVLG